jgi:UDP-3-O-[3-hydroxymyristoyl] N-acetylglucosamine deacetylase/3-hydroxyacyl-[acyl-carrier-protein] dehydratase
MTANFNPDKQHTISAPVTISGTGLHTGVMADLTLNPASPGFGFQFQRIDLPNKPIIKADCDLVTDVAEALHLNTMVPK